MNKKYDLFIKEMPIETVEVSNVYVPIIDRTFKSVGYNSEGRFTKESEKGGLIDIVF